MNPTASIRVRYLLGLSAMAVLIVSACILVQNTITRQENYSRVINIAGNQIGLSNRISFFVEQMESAETEDNFHTARTQVGRAINEMRNNHRMLLKGDHTQHIPLVMTPMLETLYFDPNFGLDLALERYLKHADTVYEAEFGTISRNGASYVFVVTYGPFVLETLLDAAVTEYEGFSRSEIALLKRVELTVMLSALLLLVVEVFLIFRPLEVKVRDAFKALRDNRDELLREKKFAERANRAKTDFLSNVSHELRTPLNAIIGFSACLEREVYGPLKSPQQRDAVANVHASGVHLLSLVNDLLDISAAEAGAIVLEESTKNIGEIVASTVVLLSSMAAENGVAIEIDEDDAMQTRLCLDGRRIRQVLINIVSNAVKFTPQGGHVRIRGIFYEDGRVGIVVSDTGVGMTPEEVCMARERFGQVANVLTRPHKGSGLGIPVAVELMNCHGGTLEIDSQPGMGTTVSMVFPKNRVVHTRQLRLVAG